MTTPNKLERAVERLKAYESGDPTSYENAECGFTALNTDLQLLLSERAELLATVERMRGGLKKITTNYGPGHLAHQIARATGEAS